ncbi:unnamed protein product [Cylicocyclus nassatus]|uniref:Uncharacterized protein n=1 Tax=Cylicocyclus nassatus TaxID=53992 RepID=A0AA36M1I7_CYLNA|nr:unnamed protein product [Cylicocyclus nassatus]
MRIFKLIFLLLTILVILSVVVVGECGIKDVLGKVGKAIKDRAIEQVKKFPKAVKQTIQVLKITGAL